VTVVRVGFVGASLFSLFGAAVLRGGLAADTIPAAGDGRHIAGTAVPTARYRLAAGPWVSLLVVVLIIASALHANGSTPWPGPHCHLGVAAITLIWRNSPPDEKVLAPRLLKRCVGPVPLQQHAAGAHRGLIVVAAPLALARPYLGCCPATRPDHPCANRRGDPGGGGRSPSLLVPCGLQSPSTTSWSSCRPGSWPRPRRYCCPAARLVS